MIKFILSYKGAFLAEELDSWTGMLNFDTKERAEEYIRLNGLNGVEIFKLEITKA